MTDVPPLPYKGESIDQSERFQTMGVRVNHFFIKEIKSGHSKLFHLNYIFTQKHVDDLVNSILFTLVLLFMRIIQLRALI